MYACEPCRNGDPLARARVAPAGEVVRTTSGWSISPAPCSAKLTEPEQSYPESASVMSAAVQVRLVRDLVAGRDDRDDGRGRACRRDLRGRRRRSCPSSAVRRRDLAGGLGGRGSGPSSASARTGRGRGRPRDRSGLAARARDPLERAGLLRGTMTPSICEAGRTLERADARRGSAGRTRHRSPRRSRACVRSFCSTFTSRPLAPTARRRMPSQRRSPGPPYCARLSMRTNFGVTRAERGRPAAARKLRTTLAVWPPNWPSARTT